MPIHHKTSANPPILVFLVGIMILGHSSQGIAQLAAVPAGDSTERTEKIEPFRIIDNVYYVGKTVHNPSFLFTSDAGHIIIDSTYEEFVPDIQQNIEKLGFNVRDVKIILSSHAHHDHVGGHALLKEVTGATMMASEKDKEVIETGGVADFRETHPWREARVDQIIYDKQTVRLGDISLMAHLTPGHTKGCTTWTTEVEEEGKKYNLVILCGFRMDEDSPLIGNDKYPEIAQDYAYSFAIAKTLDVDVFLGGHGYWFNLKDKIERLKQRPEINPFLNAEEYNRTIDGWEKAYLERLKEER
jgi:metallo-beta-lactamase class B